MTDETKRYCVNDLDKMAELAYAAGAARERRRIRRLIAKHLVDLYHQLGMIETSALRAIDAATRAPKKARTK